MREFPPRVWIHKLDQAGVVPTHALVLYEPDHEHDEFMRVSEHTALRQADLEKIAALREALEDIASGCLVPPDGGSPNLDDYRHVALKALQATAPGERVG